MFLNFICSILISLSFMATTIRQSISWLLNDRWHQTINEKINNTLMTSNVRSKKISVISEGDVPQQIELLKQIPQTHSSYYVKSPCNCIFLLFNKMWQFAANCREAFKVGFVRGPLCSSNSHSVPIIPSLQIVLDLQSIYWSFFPFFQIPSCNSI